MVEKFVDIEKTVQDVLDMHQHIPRDKLNAGAIAHYEIMARGASISGEITRFLLSEANRGTEPWKVVDVLTEIIALNLHNMVVTGSRGEDGEPQDKVEHAIVHDLIDLFSMHLHRNLEVERDEKAIKGPIVTFNRKEVGDA